MQLLYTCKLAQHGTCDWQVCSSRRNTDCGTKNSDINRRHLLVYRLALLEIVSQSKVIHPFFGKFIVEVLNLSSNLLVRILLNYCIIMSPLEQVKYNIKRAAVFMHVDTVRLCLWNAATKGPILHHLGDISKDSHGGMTLTGENRITRIATCPNTTLSTTKPIWTELGANQGLRGEKPTTSRLSHGTATRIVNFSHSCYISNFNTQRKTYCWRISARYHIHRSRVSSVSIVSDYGLDDRAIGVRSPGGGKGLFL
jgi:hypothetical protein